MNKKGFYAADTAPFYLVFGIVITILFMLFMWIISSHAYAKIKIPDGVEETVIENRFSNNCFALEDRSGAVHSGIIDFALFDEEVLKECYNTESRNKPSYNLKLKIWGENAPDQSPTIKTKNWEDSVGLDRQTIDGVLVYHNEEVNRGQVTKEIQWRRYRK